MSQRQIASSAALLIVFSLLSSILSYGENKKITKATIIRDVLVFDGSGKKPARADVKIEADRIVAVSKHLPSTASDEIVAGKGFALAPGFIDMHSHASSGIFDDPLAEVMIRQGVTTALVGQDGESDYPLADFYSKLESHPAAINLASMVGQGTLREQVMGNNLLRPSTAAELARMKNMMKQEMDAGAFGLSTGLEYDPAHFSTLEELVELSRVAQNYGGFYISHVRDEGNQVFDSFNELVEIGRQAHLPVEITHIKLGTTPVWHQAEKRMPALFSQAKADGIDLRADVYPYTYWHSGIRVIILDRDYFNPEKVAKVIDENGGPNRIHIVHFQPDPSVNNKTLAQIAQQWK
jgi:N-acyl-D-amino-acid deacylase